MSKTKSQIVAESAASNNIPVIDVPLSKGEAFGDFAGYPMEGYPVRISGDHQGDSRSHQ